MSVRIIQFTQDQARMITGIPPETLRHWRKIVPYLARRSGKAARFTFSDLVGLAVTREVIDTFGVSITTMQPSVETLFRVLADSQPSLVHSGVVIMTATTAKLYRPNQAIKLESSVPALVVPCRPHVERMQKCVLPGRHTNEQPSLPFLLRAVRR